MGSHVSLPRLEMANSLARLAKTKPKVSLLAGSAQTLTLNVPSWPESFEESLSPTQPIKISARC